MTTRTTRKESGIRVRDIASGFARTVLLLPLFAMLGCASSYDCYPCGNVSCNYCPPKPIPFAQYESCNCNDSIGRAYLANLPTHQVVEFVPVDESYLDYYQTEPETRTDQKQSNSSDRED